jgi:hypothetical protein
MRLDHISYVTSHDQLADTVQRLGSRIGSTFVDGGIHPRFGTRNFTAPLQVVNTSKLSAHLITQQRKQLHGARLSHKKLKKAADGLHGSLAPKIFHQSNQSSVATQSMVTAHAQMDLTLSGSRSALKRLQIHANYHSLFSGLQKIIHQRMATLFQRLKRLSLQIKINSLNRGLNPRSSEHSIKSPSIG